LEFLTLRAAKHPKDQEGPVFEPNDAELYEKFKPEITGNPLIIEGPHLGQDFSYFLVNGNEEMKELEKGIPLSNFCEEAQKKDMEMEYRLLTRLNCHKQQYTQLCKSRVVQFSSRNRYSEILPFMFNQVKLKETENNDKHADYINASYVDVRFEFIF